MGDLEIRTPGPCLIKAAWEAASVAFFLMPPLATGTQQASLVLETDNV